MRAFPFLPQIAMRGARVMPHRFLAVIAASLCVTSLAAQETAADPWDGLPREKSATLQIEWRGGGAAKSKAGPAEIQAETPVTLTVAGTKPGDEVRWWQLIPDTQWLSEP